MAWVGPLPAEPPSRGVGVDLRAAPPQRGASLSESVEAHGLLLVAQAPRGGAERLTIGCGDQSKLCAHDPSMQRGCDTHSVWGVGRDQWPGPGPFDDGGEVQQELIGVMSTDDLHSDRESVELLDRH